MYFSGFYLYFDTLSGIFIEFFPFIFQRRVHRRGLQDLAAKYNSKALVCAIRRNGTTIIPDGTVTLMKGDVISFAAEPNEAEHFLKLCGIKSRISLFHEGLAQ